MTNINIHRVTNLTGLNAQAQKSATTDQSYIVVQFNIVSHSHNGEEEMGVSLFLKSIDDGGQMADAFSALAHQIRVEAAK
jgi:hypothetical protein